MRLNPDCLRDVLLTIEENVGVDDFMSFPPDAPGQFPLLTGYPEDVVSYHIKQCELAGLVTEASRDLSGTFLIGHLTPDGHAFVEDIRANNNWERTKSIAQDVGSFSLQTLAQIASSVVSALLSKKLGL